MARGLWSGTIVPRASEMIQLQTADVNIVKKEAVNRVAHCCCSCVAHDFGGLSSAQSCIDS